eukprot:2337203-Pyramimonas_sp.AAC.1
MGPAGMPRASSTNKSFREAQRRASATAGTDDSDPTNSSKDAKLNGQVPSPQNQSSCCNSPSGMSSGSESGGVGWSTRLVSSTVARWRSICVQPFHCSANSRCLASDSSWLALGFSRSHFACALFLYATSCLPTRFTLNFLYFNRWALMGTPLFMSSSRLSSKGLL